MSGSDRLFQSTPPVREVTRIRKIILCIKRISIHTSRAGGDGVVYSMSDGVQEFQSTPPVREVTGFNGTFYYAKLFQSTPPVREVTGVDVRFNTNKKFQSTPPVREVTQLATALESRRCNFNPHLPCGR